MLDPSMRSPTRCRCSTAASWARDALVAKAKETGKFDYDAPIEGLQAIDRYTLRLKLDFADYELLSNLRPRGTPRRARSDRGVRAMRSGWVMANPVGTGHTA